MMRYPSQALIWSAFSLSWPALLTQITGVVSVVFLIDLAMDTDEDSLALFQAAELLIIAGLVFLYAVTLHRSHNIARTASSLGFPFRAEFALPVSTRTLLLAPLLFFCALIQVALFVPLMIVNTLFFNVEVSVLPISFIIFQLTALTLMLSWWTENGIASIAGWLVALFLYVGGYLMPDFTRAETDWIFSAEDPMDYAVSSLITAALFALTYFGVRQQRSGEKIFETGNSLFNSAERGAIRDFLPLPVTKCPVASPVAAEFWKERQLHGVYTALFAGVTGAATMIAILATIYFFAGNGPDPKNAGVLALPLYGLMCVGLTISMYGVHYKNGAPVVSLHDRVTPLSTARLTFIRTSVSLSSVLLAGMIMFAALGLLGPFLISDFQNVQSEFLGIFTVFSGLGFLDLILGIFLSCAAFLTALLLLATCLTWTMLHSRTTALVVAFVPAYLFLWSISLGAIFGDGDEGAYNQAFDTVFANHLWLVVLLIPAGLLVMLRDLLRNRVLDQAEVLYLVGIGAVLAGLNLAWLFDGGHYDVLGRDIRMVQLSYLVMQGLLPLLAAVLALWTSKQIRHG